MVMLDTKQITYTDMYSPVNPYWLIAEYGTPISQEEELDSVTRFTVAEVINPLPQLTHCISVSLFCKNNDSRSDRPLAIPSMDEHGPWYNKYFLQLKNFLNDFHNIPFFQNWKVRVYLEPEMVYLLPQLNGQKVEFHIMAAGSVGASPGALWRYLAFSDRSLDVVHVTDIDEPINDKIKYISAFLCEGDKTFGRLLSVPRPNSFWTEPTAIAKNYPSILGGRVACRPKLLQFDVAQALQAFMRLKMRKAQSEHPWKILDTDEPTVYNATTGNHPFGWGNHHHTYCFDERFLKHVIYPFAASNGLLQTWVECDLLDASLYINEEIKADLEFVASHASNSLVKVA